jgi:putative methyltransferase (TIGR04325 family)
MLPNSFKLALKEIIPPFFEKVYKSFKYQEKYGFFGNYSSWEAAKQASTGYEADIILEKTRTAMLKVKTGEVPYARDSVCFNKVEYFFPLLASLLKIALANQDHLSVLDFGGSLGTSYYQCKPFLEDLKVLKWSIVEQTQFIECGKREFENEELKFYPDIPTCLQSETPNVILISSVLPYLPDPYQFLKDVINYQFPYIIIDRTGFTLQGGDHLTVQRVNPKIYEASYPAWFLDERKFLDIFTDKYKLITDFDGFERANIASKFKGYFFQLKK